jgi:endo-1,4-beta-xylanase
MPVYFFKANFKTGNQTANASIEAMNTRVEFYAKSVLDHVLAKEKELTGGNGTIVYAVDVVNEYFHSHKAADSTVNTNGLTFWEEIYGKDADGNYLYDANNEMSTTPEYVKVAFKAAYDTIKKYGRENDISLIYNDYNTYGENTADNIVKMIQWLNTKDDINTDGDTICDGVGMQSHLAMDQDYHSPEKFKAAVEKFAAAGIEIQVTELDITNSSKSTDETLAATYKEIMKILVDAKKAGANIQSVTLWSLYDATSWRASKFPCVFKGLYNAKPAFWSLIELAEESK